MLGAALAYHDRGFCPIPQEPGAKKPSVLWKPYQDVQPAYAQVVSWFSWNFRGAGIALVLGPAFGLLVVDVDGREAYDALLDRLGGEPEAPTVYSGSGDPHKRHFYFRHPDVPTKAKATPWHGKLEFRGHRGIVIAPPSLHKSGNRYRWAEGRSLDDLPLPEVPGPILAYFEERAAREAAAAGTRAARSAARADRIAARADRITVRVARDPAPPTPRAGDVAALRVGRRSGADGGAPAGSVGQRVVCRSTREFLAGEHADGPGWNDRLFRAAADLCGCGVPHAAAEARLLAGARPRTPEDEEAARRTIASAYRQDRLPARLLAAGGEAGRPRVSPSGTRFSASIPFRTTRPPKSQP